MNASLKSFVAEAKSHIREVDCEAAKDLINRGYKPLDVREAAEYLDGTIPMALHIPRGMLEPMCDPEFAGHNPKLGDLNQPWLIFCQTGGRGALAADTMQKMGYTDVVNLAGGFGAWKASGGETFCPPIENGLIRCDHPWNPGHTNN